MLFGCECDAAARRDFRKKNHIKYSHPSEPVDGCEGANLPGPPHTSPYKCAQCSVVQVLWYWLIIERNLEIKVNFIPHLLGMELRDVLGVSVCFNVMCCGRLHGANSANQKPRIRHQHNTVRVLARLTAADPEPSTNSLISQS